MISHSCIFHNIIICSIIALSLASPPMPSPFPCHRPNWRALIQEKKKSAILKYWMSEYSQSFRLNRNNQRGKSAHTIFLLEPKQESRNQTSKWNLDIKFYSSSFLIFEMQKIILLSGILPKDVSLKRSQELPFTDISG